MSTKTAKPKDPKAKDMPVIDSKAIEERVSPFVMRAKAAHVTTVAEDEAAKKEFAAGLAIRKFIEALYEKPKRILHAAWKDMCADEKRDLAPVLEGLQIYERKCLDFKREQERKAQEEADRLAEKARKEAEELKIREAVAAEEAGDKQAAAEILAEKVERPLITVEAKVAQVDEVGTTKRWHAEVLDLKALVKYVASKCDEDPGVLCFLEPALPVLNREAVNKKSLLTIPGVKAVEEESMGGRGGFRKVD